MYEGEGEYYDESANMAGNTITTKSHESDIHTSPRQMEKGGSKYDPSVAPTETDSEFRNLEQINHDQYNEIQSWKKDLEYWQKRWLNLTLDNQLAELDLKTYVKGKTNFALENKQLKSQLSEVEKSAENSESSLTELKNKYDNALIEIMQLKKKAEEVEAQTPKYSTLEEEIVAKAMTIPDLNTTWRVIYALQAGAQQRMYAQAMTNGKQENGTTPTAAPTQNPLINNGNAGSN